MSVRKEFLKNSLFNQVDDSVSAPISIRLPTVLNNELDELSLSLDRSKSSLISEFIKAGIAAANELLKEHSLISDEMKEQFVDQREDNAASFMDRKTFMLNTNYNNDEETHFDMLKNQEAAAFCKGGRSTSASFLKAIRFICIRAVLASLLLGLWMVSW